MDISFELSWEKGKNIGRSPTLFSSVIRILLEEDVRNLKTRKRVSLIFVCIFFFAKKNRSKTETILCGIGLAGKRQEFLGGNRKKKNYTFSLSLSLSAGFLRCTGFPGLGSSALCHSWRQRVTVEREGNLGAIYLFFYFFIFLFFQLLLEKMKKKNEKKGR